MSRRIQILWGIVAGVFTILTSFLLRFTVGGVFIPELASQTLFSLVPGALEAVAVGTLGILAKYLTLGGAVLFNLLLYGVLGHFILERTKNQLERSSLGITVQFTSISYIVALGVAMVLYLLTEVLTQPISPLGLAISLIPPHAIFGVSLTYLRKHAITRMTAKDDTAPSSEQTLLTRRNALRVGILGTAAFIVSVYGLNRAFNRPEEPITTPPGTTPSFTATTEKDLLIASEVTPNDVFYTVDINAFSPEVVLETWRLKVTGLVDNPLELTYSDVQSMPATEHYNTLECISNPIGGNAISTTLWRGVLLKTVLEQVQVKPEAKYIIFRCHDGYDVGIPLERGQNSKTLLTYEMNGAPLPTGHGFPLRASVPGIYGMMHAKWITEIELVDTEFKGFWQTRGWSNTAESQTHSTIVTPGNSSLRNRFVGLRSGSSKVTVGLPTLISGIALAGERGISKVEVSVDNEQTWLPAELKEPLSEDVWVLWFLEWIPPATGTYQITVRASDKTGTLQSEKERGAYPDGATGYHSVSIVVAES